jgi:hypothetical protein
MQGYEQCIVSKTTVLLTKNFLYETYPENIQLVPEFDEIEKAGTVEMKSNIFIDHFDLIIFIWDSYNGKTCLQSKLLSPFMDISIVDVAIINDFSAFPDFR